MDVLFFFKGFLAIFKYFSVRKYWNQFNKSYKTHDQDFNYKSIEFIWGKN